MWGDGRLKFVGCATFPPTCLDVGTSTAGSSDEELSSTAA